MPPFWLPILRHSVWFLAHLVAVTLLVFATVGRSASGDDAALFVNSTPVFLGTRAWQLVTRIERNQADAEQASKELVRLGGAALPYVLPKLDSLEPAARRQVLHALAPLAVRMELASVLPSAKESEALWQSFWNDHFVDFHPAMARRVVRRFIQGPSPSRAQEVRRLDTFALGELLRDLAQLSRSGADLETTRHLLALICSVVTDPSTPCVSPAATRPQDAANLAEQWRYWWLRQHHLYEPPNGAEQLLAPILQTEYATWVRTTARSIFMGRGLGSLPWRKCLLASAQFGAALVLAVIVMRLLRPKKTRTNPRRRTYAVAGLVWLVACLPVPLLLGLANRSSALGHGSVGMLAGVSTGLWAVLYAPSASGRSPSSTSVHVHLSWLLGTVIVGENLCHAEGLAVDLLEAVKAHDLQTTIWTTLTYATLATLGHLVLARFGPARETEGGT